MPADGYDVVKEREVPDRFNDSRDEEGKPQRELHSFSVFHIETSSSSSGSESDDLDPDGRPRRGRPISICAIDEAELMRSKNPSAKHNPGRIVARGVLKASDNSGVEIEVITGPLKEWCIEYGVASAEVWVETALSWYKMTTPAPSYTRTHELARRRMEICARLYILSLDPTFAPITLPKAVTLLAHPFGHMHAYSEKEILGEAAFLIDQAGKVQEDALRTSPLVKELKKRLGGKGGGKGGGSGGGGGKKKSSSKDSAAEAVTWVPGRVENGLSASDSGMIRRIDGILSKLVKDKRALPFMEPVDPRRHGCADYFDVVKEPMDLGTIQTRLTRKYYAKFEEVMTHLRLVWSNCKKYNPPGSELCKSASELERKLERMVVAAETAEIQSVAKRAQSSQPPTSADPSPSPPSSQAPSTAPADKTPPQPAPSSDPNPKPSKRKRSSIAGSTPATSPAASPPASVAKPPVWPDGGGESKSGAGGVGGPAAKEAPAVPGSGKPCTNPRCPGAEARMGSKYCSDECGLQVASARLQSMMDRGLPIPDFIKTM